MNSQTGFIKRYFFQHLGQSTDMITKLKNGTHPFSETLKNAKKPLVILGADQLSRKDGAKILAETQQLAKIVGEKANVSRILFFF